MNTIDVDHRHGVICPFCDSHDVELVSAWGGQLITSQMRCRRCNSHFEALRDDYGSPAARDHSAPPADLPQARRS